MVLTITEHGHTNLRVLHCILYTLKDYLIGNTPLKRYLFLKTLETTRKNVLIGIFQDFKEFL